MSATDLTSLLPVNDGNLRVGADTAPGPVLADQLVRLTNGAPIVIHNATRSIDGAAVNIVGKTNMFNMVDLPVTVTATPGTGGPIITMRFTMIDGQPGPNAWRFSRSFPDLPPFNAGARMDKTLDNGASTQNVNLLDRLLLSDAAFVLTTAESGTDSVTGAPVRTGLNFVARLIPTDLIGLLGSMLSGGAPVTLSGQVIVPRPTELTLPFPKAPMLKFPWQLPQPPPGIHLRADLGIDSRLGNALRFHDAGLRIYCPTTKAWTDANPTLSPVMAAAAKLDVPSAEISLDLTASSLTSPNNLMLFGMFEGVTLGRLAQLMDVAGGADLATRLPDDVQTALNTLGGLSLEAVTLQLGRGFTVNGVGITVGLRGINTTVLPGFTVENLIADFSVSQPFGPGRALSVTLGGSVGFAGAPFDINVELPEVSAMARMTDDVTLPLNALFREAGLPAPPDLTVNEMQFAADKNGNLSFATAIAKNPSWTLDLGPVPLTVSDVVVIVNRPSGGPAGGRFSGVINLGDDLELAVAYQTPGDFTMRGELPDVRLLQLIGKLTNQSIALPNNFDLAFTDNVVLIQKTGADMVFQLATTMENLGTVAFEARRMNGAQSMWGFAAGIDMTGLRLSNLPGLGALKSFEEVFRLDELLVVVASFDDPGFRFPSLAAFNSPIIRAGDLNLPAQAGGVIRGLNIYARWTLDTASREQELLRKFLGLNPSMGVTLQVGTTPSENSRLYVSYDTLIQGLPFSCKFGGQMVGGQGGLFLTGALEARIQEQPVRFDVNLLFVSSGAFLSGSMRGRITFEGLTLSNLALVIGVNWSGIPSIGIAATLTAARFQSSLAIFFDSTTPSQSMLAGALSDLSLKDVLDAFAGKVIPSEIDAVLGKVALVGTSEFTIGADVAKALDNLQIDVVSAAFSKQGVLLPADSSQVLLNVGERGKKWFLTDMTKMLSYELVSAPGGVRVTLNPQFYCAPKTTFIGALRFDQGIFLNAGLEILSFDAMAKILVKPSQGISVDGAMDRIVIGTEALFSVRSSDGKQGPRISAATFSQPSMQDPALKGPHFLIDGALNLLGLKRGVYINLNAKGFAFMLNGALAPGFTYDLNGHFSGPKDMGVGGLLNIGVGVIDLGQLGKANINSGVTGSFDAGVSESKIWAKFAGGFEFAGEKLLLQTVDLDVHTASLPELPWKLVSPMAEALKTSLKDAAKWLRLVRSGVITGVSDVNNTLKTVYGATSQQALILLKDAGYTVNEAGALIKTGYGATVDQAAPLLKGAGFAADQVGKALSAVYSALPQQAAQLLTKAGYTIGEVNNALNITYGAMADQAAKWLNGAGYAADKVCAILKTSYNAKLDQAAKWLRGAGYATNDIVNSLQTVYNATAQQTAQALFAVGYTLNEVGNAISAGWGKSADVVASALKGAGYSLNDVGGYLKGAFNLEPGQLNDVLQRAGFPADQIKGFFKSLGGSFSNFFGDVGKKAEEVGKEVGKKLDPRNWF
jgi:hypothetical protein